MAKGQFRKARYVTPDKSRIDLELDHPILGWIEMTISEEDYPEVWKQVVATKPTFSENLAEEYEATQLMTARQRMVVDRAKFCIGLRNLGVIDQQWAVHAAQGNLPVSMHASIVAGGERLTIEDASIIWAGLTSVPRGHAFVEAIRKHKNLTPTQMDAVFE